MKTRINFCFSFWGVCVQFWILLISSVRTKTVRWRFLFFSLCINSPNGELEVMNYFTIECVKQNNKIATFHQVEGFTITDEYLKLVSSFQFSPSMCECVCVLARFFITTCTGQKSQVFESVGDLNCAQHTNPYVSIQFPRRALHLPGAYFKL